MQCDKYGAAMLTDLGVLDVLRHLRVRELLVDHDAADQLRLLQSTARLALHLDHVEVDIVVIQVGHRQHRINCNLRHLPLIDIDDLRAQRSHGGVNQRSRVVLAELHPVRDSLQMLVRHLRSSLEALRDPNRMQSSRQQLLSLLQQGASQHHDSGGPVPDLVVLGLGQIDEQLRHLVLHFHFLQDSRPVVGYRHFPI